MASIPATMRAIVATGYGATDVLVHREVPTPSPEPEQVLVAVRASSLNALDWHFVSGTPYLIRMMNGLRRPKRMIPGADVAGIVVDVGAAVTRFAVGDAVFGECSGGGCSPYLAVHESHVVAKPDDVSFEHAAATPVAGLTALQGLRTHGAVQPGEHVLVNGAAGGVGTFAVQFATALGAEVTAVCSSRNVDLVRSLGADTVIDYTTTDFVEGGAQFDVMLDNVGNRTPAECLAVLRRGARYVAVSGPKENRWLGPVPHIVRTGIAFWRAEPSFHQFTAAPVVGDLQFLGELLSAGSITPVIDRVVGLDGVAAGITEISTGHARAKIVVTPT
jgi:NADPH:quinone reductase-like Zn-dependent oxidoreductase